MWGPLAGVRGRVPLGNRVFLLRTVSTGAQAEIDSNNDEPGKITQSTHKMLSFAKDILAVSKRVGYLLPLSVSMCFSRL